MFAPQAFRLVRLAYYAVNNASSTESSSQRYRLN